jgi:hypothetical protein
VKRSDLRNWRAAAAAIVLVLASTAALAPVGSAGAVPSVRGFDGKTITVAGLGIKAQLPAAETGARARIKRFNDTNEIKGVKLTKLGRRVFSDSIAKMKDPWRRPIYWIGGGSVTWSSGEGTDISAVNEGFISVTPLHLDVTHQARLDDSELWWKAP